MDRIERIKDMEAKLDAALKAVSDLDKALAAYEEALPGIGALAAYLTSDDWKDDSDADHEGELPADLKRGVLSEDGIFNMLEDNREVQVKVSEVLVRIVRHGRH